jgi:peptide/nickel transport system substrate-binding protein
LDFSVPPAAQAPVSGLVPAKSIILVRNPSWTPASDPLRPAYVDRIEVRIGGTLEEYSGQVDAGQLDLLLASGPPVQAPAEQISAYRSDPAKGIVSTDPRDFVRYISMNLATPPFDDLHVRKAMNWVVDKQALIDASGGADNGQAIGHIALNSLENNLLLSYDPYATPGHHGSLENAQREMAQSPYDSNHDGLCDAPACRHILALAFDTFTFPAVARIVRKNARAIGIDLRVQTMDPDVLFGTIGDPKQRVPLAIGVAWGRDLLNASNYFAPLFAQDAIGDESVGNYSLTGATPSELRRWGYSVSEVPSVDDRIDACLADVGVTQLRCWADLDQYMMEAVVPWVPYVSESHVQIVPARIVNYSYDQFATLPALDRIALKPEG